MMAKSNNLSCRQFLKTTSAAAMASSVAGFSDVLAVWTGGIRAAASGGAPTSC